MKIFPAAKSLCLSLSLLLLLRDESEGTKRSKWGKDKLRRRTFSLRDLLSPFKGPSRPKVTEKVLRPHSTPAPIEEETGIVSSPFLEGTGPFNSFFGNHLKHPDFPVAGHLKKSDPLPFENKFKFPKLRIEDMANFGQIHDYFSKEFSKKIHSSTSRINNTSFFSSKTLSKSPSFRRQPTNKRNGAVKTSFNAKELDKRTRNGFFSNLFSKFHSVSKRQRRSAPEPRFLSSQWTASVPFLRGDPPRKRPRVPPRPLRRSGNVPRLIHPKYRPSQSPLPPSSPLPFLESDYVNFEDAYGYRPPTTPNKITFPPSTTRAPMSSLGPFQRRRPNIPAEQSYAGLKVINDRLSEVKNYADTSGRLRAGSLKSRQNYLSGDNHQMTRPKKSHHPYADLKIRPKNGPNYLTPSGFSNSRGPNLSTTSSFLTTTAAVILTTRPTTMTTLQTTPSEIFESKQDKLRRLYQLQNSVKEVTSSTSPATEEDEYYYYYYYEYDDGSDIKTTTRPTTVPVLTTTRERFTKTSNKGRLTTTLTPFIPTINSNYPSYSKAVTTATTTTTTTTTTTIKTTTTTEKTTTTQTSTTTPLSRTETYPYKKASDYESCSKNEGDFCDVSDLNYPQKAVVQIVITEGPAVQGKYQHVVREFPDLVGGGGSWERKKNHRVGSCEVEETSVKPGWAKNAKGEWLAVVNTDEYNQELRTVKCSAINASCTMMYSRMKSQCFQKYTTRELMVVDPRNPEKGTFISKFNVPSSCACSLVKINGFVIPNTDYKPSVSLIGDRKEKIKNHNEERTDYQKRRTVSTISTKKSTTTTPYSPSTSTARRPLFSRPYGNNKKDFRIHQKLPKNFLKHKEHHHPEEIMKDNSKFFIPSESDEDVGNIDLTGDVDETQYKKYGSSTDKNQSSPSSFGLANLFHFEEAGKDVESDLQPRRRVPLSTTTTTISPKLRPSYLEKRNRTTIHRLKDKYRSQLIASKISSTTTAENFETTTKKSEEIMVWAPSEIEKTGMNYDEINKGEDEGSSAKGIPIRYRKKTIDRGKKYDEERQTKNDEEAGLQFSSLSSLLKNQNDPIKIKELINKYKSSPRRRTSTVTPETTLRSTWRPSSNLARYTSTTSPSPPTFTTTITSSFVTLTPDLKSALSSNRFGSDPRKIKEMLEKYRQKSYRREDSAPQMTPDTFEENEDEYFAGERSYNIEDDSSANSYFKSFSKSDRSYRRRPSSIPQSDEKVELLSAIKKKYAYKGIPNSPPAPEVSSIATSASTTSTTTPFIPTVNPIQFDPTPISIALRTSTEASSTSHFLDLFDDFFSDEEDYEGEEEEEPNETNFVTSIFDAEETPAQQMGGGIPARKPIRDVLDIFQELKLSFGRVLK